MKKLRLELDGLEVESFTAAAAPGREGTVRAAQPTELDCTLDPSLCKPTGPEAHTCQLSCTGSGVCFCDASHATAAGCCAGW